ncbi:DUF2935 domain-containing protein [Bacillus shivajii]|uniref:DUF2935 domain-containing protein n=1 Tax=Bacillus shivajii TaxID=1983719 RepID=UPI001CFBB322|nr:DUF2935 domain-containing protein [Bacillus shivajii]UCZ53124.1 DUF2935 domain-containing protein [Bacillus shivajii]
MRDELLFELEFWLQVLGDHSRFIYESLSPGERNYVARAEGFIDSFDELLGEARRFPNEQALMTLLRQANEETEKLRELKLAIIREHLEGDIAITLPPSFLNHMVNELDEALRIFSYFLKGERPPKVHPLHHDLIWLLDAAGHAAAISSNMDHVEYDIREKSDYFKEEWEEFYIKAVEMAGFLRANVSQFPALKRFHRDIELEMEVFKAFLRELEEMQLTKESLGVLSPLMADHMAREECYYLMKLAETTEVVQMPDCDPTKPRTED